MMDNFPQVRREDFAILDKLQLDTLKNLMQECHNTKCSACPVLEEGNCALGGELQKYNKDQPCPFPILQAKSRVYGIEVFDETVLLKRLQDIFKVMREWATDPKDCKYMMDCLMKIKEEYFPSIKKNLNINVDMEVQQKFMDFYDEVKDEATHPNQARRPIQAEQVIDYRGLDIIDGEE